MSDINFMEKYDYINITPFKWFVLQNFPFIEADFDALTNWQLFCKLGKEMNIVIDKVNESGEQVENLTNAFIQLQQIVNAFIDKIEDDFDDFTTNITNDFDALETFVNNYFDNLDVQEEINNKLDDMAESGELTEIIMNYLSVVKTYNTFTSIAEDVSSLVNGNIIKTLGYSTINDGGDALYYVTTTENSSIYQEHVGDFYLTLITPKMVNILQIGCNETINNTTKIQSILDLGYDLFIPEKTFLIDSIELKFNKQKIEGLGLKSVLKANTISTGLIKITSTIIDCEITDIYLNGDNKTGDAIYVTHTSINEDSKETFKNLFIGYFNGRGIALMSGNIHSAIIQNCKVRNCSDGIYINGTDNFVTDTICYFNTNHGIYIYDNGSNTKITSSKTYGNVGAGIYSKGSCCTFSNVETQDNYSYGIYLKGWNNMADITVGNNCQQSVNNGQIYCDGLNDSIVNAVVNVTEHALTLEGVGKYALECNGNNANNIINIQTHKFGRVNIIPFKYNPNVSNKVTINGIKYYPENVFEGKSLGKVGTTANLSEIFYSANIRANSNGSISCNSTDQTQYITINNSVTGDYTSGITIVGRVNLTADVTKADVYINLTNALTYNSDVLMTELNVQWLSSGGSEISHKSTTGNMSLLVSDTKPENATTLQFQINFFPRQAHITQTCGITCVQVGLYE